jgi:ubiquinone biosynthesis protein COQ4
MKRLELLRRAAPLLRNPETFGDGAVLKSIAITDGGSARVREALAPLRGFIADVDPARLAALPEGTFGRAVSDFCAQNRITLLRPNPTLTSVAAERYVPVRYAATHDMVHVLIGEGADYAGEAAVYAFSCAQGYARMHVLALVLACTFWPLLAPTQALRIWRGAWRGYRKGRRSGILLAHRFEDRFEAPLAEVREECGVAGL